MPRRPQPKQAPSLLRIEFDEHVFEIDLLDGITFADVRDIRRAAGLSFNEIGDAAKVLAPEFVGGLAWLQLRKTDPTLGYETVLARMPLSTDWAVVVPTDPPASGGK